MNGISRTGQSSQDRALDPRRFQHVGVGSVFVVAVALLTLRRPEILLRPQFVWEEASWYAVTFVVGPLASLTESWAGFLYLVPRGAFLAARLVPPEIAPSITGAVLILLVGGVAGSLASERLGALGSPASRFFLGCSVGVLPAASGPFLSVLNVGWISSLPLAMIAVARDPATRLGKVGECLVLVAASLTGPAAILLAPLYGVAARSPYRALRAGIVGAAALIQLATFAASARRPAEGLAPSDIPTVLLGRLSTSLLGDGVSAVAFVLAPGSLVAVGLAIVVVLAFLLRRTKLPANLALLYLGLALGALGIIGTGAQLENPTYGTRYFLVAAIALVAIALAGLEHGQRLGIVILGMFVIGAVADFRMPVPPDTDWPAHARCIGGPLPCTVPIHPPAWSVDWPGRDGRYVAPTGFDDLGRPVYE